MNKKTSSPKRQKRSKSRMVWYIFWDSGGFGSGAGEERVYERDGFYRYTCTDTGDDYGPTKNLKQLLEDAGLTQLTGAECRIESPLFTAAEIASMLVPIFDLEPWQPLAINNETWVWVGGRWQSEEEVLRADVSKEEAARRRQFFEGIAESVPND
jgi:hypothetical protein